MKASPPIPVIIGSVTLSMAAIAIDASTSLPPRLSTSRPACEASGWLLATIACWLRTMDRPGLLRKVWPLSWARGWMLVVNISAVKAVAMQTRATARSNVVRYMDEPFRLLNGDVRSLLADRPQSSQTFPRRNPAHLCIPLPPVHGQHSLKHVTWD